MASELERRYQSYLEDCLGWNLPAQSFAYFKAYWEFFAKEGELAPEMRETAPILVQRL
jgi:hypothetical protein